MTSSRQGFVFMRTQAPRRSHVSLVATIITLVTVAGCGATTASPQAGRSASVAKDEGMAALEKKDWKAAEESLTKALSLNVLSGDQYEEAVLGRVRARLELGEYAAAKEDLTPLEFQASSMDQVMLLKCRLALSQNDVASAQAAFAEAKKFNSKLPKPEGLK